MLINCSCAIYNLIPLFVLYLNCSIFYIHVFSRASVTCINILSCEYTSPDK